MSQALRLRAVFLFRQTAVRALLCFSKRGILKAEKEKFVSSSCEEGLTDDREETAGGHREF